MIDRPAHLLAVGGAKRTLCGIKVDDQRNPNADLPHLLARFVGRHQRGHNLTVCDTCEVAANQQGIELDVSA